MDILKNFGPRAVDCATFYSRRAHVCNLVDSGLSVWGGKASRNSKNPGFRLFLEDFESFYNYLWNKNRKHSHFPKMSSKKYTCSSNIALTLFLKIQVCNFQTLTHFLNFRNPKFRGFPENHQIWRSDPEMPSPSSR